jgi:hypothetical protein
MGLHCPQDHYDDLQELSFHYEFLKGTDDLGLRLKKGWQRVAVCNVEALLVFTLLLILKVLGKALQVLLVPLW